MNNYYYFPFDGDHPVTSPYGWRTIDGVRDFHPGTDFGWNPEEGPSFPVLAAAEGDVIYYADEGLGGGRTLTLAHEGNEQSRYYHLDHPIVAVGDHVGTHQLIAMSGNTGGVAPHLHLEIHDRNGGTVDPFPLLQRWAGPPTPAPAPPAPAPPIVLPEVPVFLFHNNSDGTYQWCDGRNVFGSRALAAGPPPGVVVVQLDSDELATVIAGGGYHVIG